ncbi:MAG TPA: DUF4982 domain-containing protein [Tepidisphaeraceae bacterium]|nr:DUF4982 domain-containing protein [Tepidisphaeraceae bacterium]
MKLYSPIVSRLPRLAPLACLILCLLPPAAAAAAQEAKLSADASPRRAYNFNSDWRVFVGDAPGAEAGAFDDAKWKGVTLPHGWNEDHAFRVSIADLPTGIAWYRKRFTLPPGAAGKKVYIEFQGIRHGGEFFLNGKSIGGHDNGVMAFGFDLTPHLKPPGEENVIAARIDSAWTYRERATNTTYQWNDRNFYVNHGGINKNVVLHVTDPLHQTLPLFSNLGTIGTYVYAGDIDVANRSATVNVESQVKNDGPAPKTFTFEVSVADMDGKVVKTFDGGQQALGAGESRVVKASAKLDGLNFWSWGYGYLYTVTTTLKVDGKPIDAATTRTGFRKTAFTDGALTLNDRVLHLKGYAQRTTNEWPALGINIPPWVSDFSNGLMVQSNANLVRWMHVTPSKQDVESCDRVGLIQAMPAGDSERDSEDRKWEQRLELMRDAIVYNRNNPSILFYEAGNKGVSETHMKQMLDVRDKFDPHGGRAMGSREMLASKLAEWGGEMLYVNKSAGKPLWQTEYSRDEGLRKYADEFTPPYHKDGDGPPHRNEPAPSYNRNQDTHAVENVRRWYDFWRERPGTGTRVNGGGVNIIFSDSNSHHRGAENYRRSGEVDAMRIPKEGFFAHQVMWDGWVDAERPAAHIIGHWNYKPGTKKDIFVVSSSDRVELQLNGKSLGAGEQSYRFLYTFKNVEWQPGTLRALGFAADGKQVCEAQVKTTGEPAAVKLTPRTRPGGVRADGSDLALLDVEVVDADGNRVPTAFHQITFDVTGPAEWRGGIAQGPDNFILSKKLPVELGVNRVSVRSTGEAGTILIKATADGLKPATVELASQSVPVTGGLSTAMPDDGLKPSLSRGPTPAGPSFAPVRTPIKIAKVTAGSNAERAAMTMDDNETTNWTSAGVASESWIRYEFESPARVSEVTLKLGGWRSRSYPVRIRVDKKIVFTGNTPRSLGYVTLPLEPAEGQSLSIEVAGGGASDQDAFGGIVEVTGEKDVTTRGSATTRGAGGGGGGGRAGGRGPTLEIIEAEIYGSPAGSR